MSEIYYVGNKTMHGLVKGTKLLVAADQSDVYRISSIGETFFIKECELTFNKNDEKECTRYAISRFDLEFEDPYSRGVIGPFEYTGLVIVDFDGLPDNEVYKLSRTREVGSHICSHALCVNSWKYTVADFLNGELDEMINDAVLAMFNTDKSVAEINFDYKVVLHDHLLK